MSDPVRLPAKHTRRLRSQPTPTESALWDALRDRKLAGLKFRRQHPITGTAYVVDFCCPELNLVIEIDGAVHGAQVEGDIQRQQDIEDAGYTVLRFTASEVENDLPHVLRQIVANVVKVE